MEFRQSEEQGKDQFSDEDQDGQIDRESEEEEEEKKQVNNIKTTNNYINATRSNSSSSSSSSRRHHNLSFSGPSSSTAKKWPPEHAVLMDYLSLKTTTGTDDVAAEAGGGEREHMFDKVVTPSDVGKLNRLVIPKQHAERYFPLDSASTEKGGLLLNFEDRGGKSWRFRYSYWNSSQSYVMTKGWSRFVKDKKLDAGDIVSFHRSPLDPLRLFIDCRRRPHPHYSNHHFFHHNHHNLMIPGPGHYHHQHRWPGTGIGVGTAYTLPPPSEAGFHYTPAHDHRHQYRYPHSESMTYQVPAAVVAAPKRLRLFGVNMECGSPSQEDNRDHAILHLHHQRQQQQVRMLPNNNTISSAVFPIMPTTTSSSGGFIIPPEFSNKGKSSANSLSFDLDP